MNSNPSSRTTGLICEFTVLKAPIDTEDAGGSENKEIINWEKEEILIYAELSRTL